jgi:isoleucyl-tRNA synthetase
VGRSTDYSGELFDLDEILKRVVEAYRRIRNTLRFLLANTSDFDAAKDAVAPTTSGDRPLRARRDAAMCERRPATTRATSSTSCAAAADVLLRGSRGFYLDVLKDRLYTTGKTSRARRSAQTALALIRDALLLLAAPVLSFTAEEAWRILRPDEPSIFCRTGWSLAAPRRHRAADAKWSRDPRRPQCRAEGARDAAAGGRSVRRCRRKSQSAAGCDYEALASLGDDLRFVSSRRPRVVTRAEQLSVTVTPSRTREVRALLALPADVGSDAQHPTLCGRCVANLFGSGERARSRDPGRCPIHIRPNPFAALAMARCSGDCG